MPRHLQRTRLHPLERTTLAAIRRNALITPGEHGLVSVSGGPDSMALLCVLTALGDKLGVSLEVVHFDHGLRAESEREAEWVARQVGALGLPLHVVKARHLAGLDSGVQTAARTWRREEARRLLAQWEAQWVATGHQRDDSTETWLLKWLRGAHLSRLRGMAWREGPFIRPLLGSTRAELTAYLEAREQEWLEDPSNRSPAYRRNRVRHELIPLLNELSGGALPRRLEALDDQSASLAGWLEAELAAHPLPQSDPGPPPHWIAADPLGKLPGLLRGAALHRFVTERAPGALRFDQVQQAVALLSSGGPVWRLILSGRRTLRRQGDRLLLEPGPAIVPPGGPEQVLMAGGFRIHAPHGWRIEVAVTEAGQEFPDCGGGLVLHRLPPMAALEIRARRPGDRFQPPWKDRPVKMKEFLRDRQIPLSERDNVPLVLLDGKIIAVYPLVVAREFSPENTLRAEQRSAAKNPALWLKIEADHG